MMLRRLCAGWGIAVALMSANAAGEAPACKTVTHYGVSGCEMLPGQTCPAGYHIQAVNPPNPQMMGPTYLMCVPNKPPAKEEPPKSPPKTSEQRSPDAKS
ncbi:MAG: hypothetical protein WBQ72_04940 [Terriglobales bacterium]|jgi:hypothetical protein